MHKFVLNSGFDGSGGHWPTNKPGSGNHWSGNKESQGLFHTESSEFDLLGSYPRPSQHMSHEMGQATGKGHQPFTSNITNNPPMDSRPVAAPRSTNQPRTTVLSSDVSNCRNVPGAANTGGLNSGGVSNTGGFSPGEVTNIGCFNPGGATNAGGINTGGANNPGSFNLGGAGNVRSGQPDLPPPDVAGRNAFTVIQPPQPYQPQYQASVSA